MKSINYIIIISLLLFASGCKQESPAVTGKATAPDMGRKEIPKARNRKFHSDIRFYIFDQDFNYRETNEVPLVPGLNYGWILRAKTGNVIHWKEELILPRKPRLWDEEPAQSNVQITEYTEMPDPSTVGNKGYGLIDNFWSVIEGDPEGIYNFRIYINGKLEKEFPIHFYESDGEEQFAKPAKRREDL